MSCQKNNDKVYVVKTIQNHNKSIDRFWDEIYFDQIKNAFYKNEFIDSPYDLSASFGAFRNNDSLFIKVVVVDEKKTYRLKPTDPMLQKGFWSIYDYDGVDIYFKLKKDIIHYRFSYAIDSIYGNQDDTGRIKFCFKDTPHGYDLLVAIPNEKIPLQKKKFINFDIEITDNDIINDQEVYGSRESIIRWSIEKFRYDVKRYKNINFQTRLYKDLL